jgi:prolyl oligopeptidase
MPQRRTLAALAVLASACGSSSPSTPPPAAPIPPPVATPAPPPPPAPVRDFPATRRADVVETIQGTQVHDPYRWLEDASKPEVQQWMTAQDTYARERLAKLPLRAALLQRFTETFYFDSTDAPRHRGDRFFFMKKRKDREKAQLYWKQGERGAEKLLIDPETWSSDGSAGLHGWSPSDDGRYVTFNKSEHNADETVLGIIDVTTGKLLPDTITGTKYADPSWTPDGRGFYYVWLPPISSEVTVADRPGFAELRYHKLGTDPVKDPTIRDATRNPQTFLNARVSHDGHWLIVDVQHGWNSTDLYFKDLRKDAKLWTTLVENVPADFQLEDHDDVFYVRSNDGAPRYRIFAVDPRKPERAKWTEIVAQSDATLQGHRIAGGKLVLTYLRDAVSELAIHDLRGKQIRKVALPALGSVTGITGRAVDDDFYVEYTSFSEAHTVFKVSVKTGAVAPWAKVELPLALDAIVTEQVKFSSADGTQITMFLAHKKDAAKDGKTPVYLTGYGGFNVAMAPGFVSSRSSWAANAVWIEHGGLVAIPNLRGGGEYGEDWHKAGMLLEKQHVFDDFLAAARWLEASGWTSRDHLAISGGSNGGLLMGAAVTQGPELFKAVVIEVPLLDMVRYHLFGSGKTWVPEYGSADDAAQFKALYAYSPYHHVKPGTAYPAVLLSSSDHDDRVDPLHARKFTAALQAATSSDAPLWLRIQRNAGHSGVDQVKARVEQAADTYAFLMWQLGMN